MSTPTIPAPLRGKTAIVTGGSRGIGRGIALHFAAQGASKIAINYAFNPAAAKETEAQIHKINPDIKTTTIQADVLSPTFAQDVVSQTLANLSTQTIDIVVSNAANLSTDDVVPLTQTTKEGFLNLVTGNAWTPLQLALAAIPHIAKGGRIIINISSVDSKQGCFDPVVSYGASKAMLDSFTRSLALH